MGFDAPSIDFIVYHEQLHLLSTQYIELEGEKDQKLVNANVLHTSPENRLFSSPNYNEIENRTSVRSSKLVVTLQLEALLSISKFQDSLAEKLPQDIPEEQVKKKKKKKKIKKLSRKMVRFDKRSALRLRRVCRMGPNPAEFGSGSKKASAIFNPKYCFLDIDHIGHFEMKILFYLDIPASPSLQIKAGLEEFRIISASKQARLFDIQVQCITADGSQTLEKTLIGLSLSNLRVFNPYQEARYKKV